LPSDYHSGLRWLTFSQGGFIVETQKTVKETNTVFAGVEAIPVKYDYNLVF
jgi:hypothetical protein